MVATLDRIVDDKNLAWTATSLSTEDYTITLSDQTLRELRSGDLPDKHKEASIYLKHFPSLEAQISDFYKKQLKTTPGFGIIKGLNPKEFSRQGQEMVYWMISGVLGTPLEQNAQGEIRYEVKDKGKRMEEGGRYSESRQAGVLHTDSIQWEHPPEVVGLLCLHPAMSGGESVIMSAYSLHNKLLQNHPELLRVLYEPFPFETRKSTGEVNTISKPVFRYDTEKGLRFEYIGTYVPQKSLTSEQAEAKKILDETLEDSSLVVELGTLQAGDMQFLMNFRNAHGRKTDFVNYPEPERERIMVRAWLREK